ncbi:hypothetical protein AB0L06_11695 [Spirillospora sp. NPDC052269]
MRWLHATRAWFRRNSAGGDLGWMFDADSRTTDEERARRVHETLTASPVTAGWVVNAQPQRLEGYVGVALWVALLGPGGGVGGRRIWIEASGVQSLLDVADRIRSPEFREAMGDFGDSYS